MYKKVYFVDDIFRKEIAEARQCIFKTLYAIFKRAFNITIKAPAYDNDIFKPIRERYKDWDWTKVYFGLPKEVEEEYVSLLDKDAIYLSYEAPIWLYKIWKKYHIKYIDLRLSYLRYLPDIPVMFSTNIKSAFRILKSKELQVKDLILEADLCKASYNFRHFRDWHNLKRYEGGLIFIGQTDKDTSLMCEGRTSVVKLKDYETKIKEILPKYEKIFYKPHPFASVKHKEEEINYITSISKKTIPIIKDNFYNLATQDYKIDFIGLSSGALQEAEMFGKVAYQLMDYPFSSNKSTEDLTYININAFYFFSPKFWQEMLDKELLVQDKCNEYREPHANMMRDFHNASWGFNEFYFENRLSTNDQLQAWGTVSSKLINNFNALTKTDNIVRDVANFSKNRFNYYRCRLLANLTFGRMRAHYINKKKAMKQKIQRVKTFMGGGKINVYKYNVCIQLRRFCQSLFLSPNLLAN